MITPSMNKLKQLLKCVTGFNKLDQYFCHRHTGFYDGERFRRGHYYSSLPDIEEVQRDAAHLFRKDIDLGPSTDLRPDSQQALLSEFVSFYDEFCWAEQPSSRCRFHLGQEWFCYGDALILYSMLRNHRPNRVIEVGSGFSSALMLDTNDLFLNGTVQFKFIEPYPERLLSLLSEADKTKCEIIQDKVQNVSISTFQRLDANDILFIDSSHVSKIGSDLNYLLFEVLPALKPGVIVHFHDIFWPFEYPIEWIVNKWAWNEAYLLRAFLQYNSHFKIYFFNSYAGYFFSEFIKEQMPIFMKNTGGSLWLQKAL